MVRGDINCPFLCGNCRTDCTCRNCRQCHTCKYNLAFERGYLFYNGKLYGCNDFAHQCPIPEKPEAEAAIGNMLGFAKLFSSDMIDVRIGKDVQENRIVPKTALVENSEYFRSTLMSSALVEIEPDPTSPTPSESTLTSAPRVSIILDSVVDRADAFDCFIQFAFWKDYRTAVVETGADMALHAHVYVLAERLQTPDLKDLAVRKASKLAIFFGQDGSASASAEAFSLTWVLGVIETVYLYTVSSDETHEQNSDTFTTSKDPFRMIMAAFCAHCLHRVRRIPEFEKCIRRFPDFAVDLFSQVSNKKQLEVDERGYLRVT